MDHLLEEESPTQPVPARRPGPTDALGLAATLALAACGGGNDGADTSAANAPASADGGREQAAAAAPPVTAAAVPPTRQQAARLLAQAGFGGSAADIARVQALGRNGWLNEQFAMPAGRSYLSLVTPPTGPDADDNDGRNAVERALWRKLITSPDVLRQRMTLALSEIFVISIPSVLLPNRGFACAAFMDILERNAFGNYRDLLLQVSTSAAMGAYLTFLNSKKADPVTGSQPDENYARELMQLFTIGVVQLRLGGTVIKDGGVPVETYNQADVTGLARVFTGWALTNERSGPYDAVTKPMRQIPGNHEPGEKHFLDYTIPANTSGEASLELAIDRLMRHPNVAPFVSRQLIQRLVTSNPSPAYVRRVATAFNGGTGELPGNLQSTLRAVLTDPEAFSETALADPNRGKLREPMLRFVQWARLFGLPPGPAGYYGIGNLGDPATRLAQSPLRSPTVFNFFRPGYVPPNSELGQTEATAPEFQITTDTSVAGYLNFMQAVTANGYAGSRVDYTAWLPLCNDSAALLAELNVLLAAGQVSAATLARLKTALDTIAVTTDAGRRRRLLAALTMVMGLPEYIVLK